MRHVYEQQLTRANDLYLEVCAVRLQLEQREAALAEWVQASGPERTRTEHTPMTLFETSRERRQL